MKKMLLTFVCVAISLGAFAQITYLADTAFTTDAGYGGAPASCTYAGGGVYGWNVQYSADEWVADQFIVPAGATWTFDTVVVYAYQWGSGLTSTFNACYLQVYDGIPGAGGAVIWGDTTTSVLAATGFSGIYRIDTAASTGGIMGTDRPIMYLKLYLSPVLSLGSGSYWLSWTTSGTSSSTPECPEKVLPGRINPGGQVARKYGHGTWSSMVDKGNDVGLDMIIKARAGVVSVPAAVGRPVAILQQNVPNPFNTTTDISFYLPEAGPARLTVYNTFGQTVKMLFDQATSAGQHNIAFNADGLPAGLYYYQLCTNAGRDNRYMLLMK